MNIFLISVSAISTTPVSYTHLILKAVEAALVEAGANVEDFKKPVEAKEVAAPDYFPTMGSVELPEKWDESYDVVVVGGGFAGLAAAYAAEKAGSRWV